MVEVFDRRDGWVGLKPTDRLRTSRGRRLAGHFGQSLVWTYEILMEGSGLFQQGSPSIVLR